MPHANDMTHWPEIRCQRGHIDHLTKKIDVNLAWHRYRDWPQVPPEFQQMFEMEIWDYAPYMTDGPYCPARDVVSEVIETHGCWEPMETIVMLDCFHRAPGNMFVDMGAQVGWYSKLASNLGMKVTAFEADPDVVELLERNAPGALVYGDRIGPESTAGLPADHHPHLTIKMDLEGAEPDGVRMHEGYLNAGWVDFALIEISPVFHHAYYDMVNDLLTYDMIPLRLPGKSNPPHPYRGIDALHQFSGYDLEFFLDQGHQENVLFVRRNLL
jgi:hypothetical protein